MAQEVAGASEAVERNDSQELVRLDQELEKYADDINQGKLIDPDFLKDLQEKDPSLYQDLVDELPSMSYKVAQGAANVYERGTWALDVTGHPGVARKINQASQALNIFRFKLSDYQLGRIETALSKYITEKHTENKDSAETSIDSIDVPRLRDKFKKTRGKDANGEYWVFNPEVKDHLKENYPDLAETLQSKLNSFNKSASIPDGWTKERVDTAINASIDRAEGEYFHSRIEASGLGGDIESWGIQNGQMNVEFDFGGKSVEISKAPGARAWVLGGQPELTYTKNLLADLKIIKDVLENHQGKSVILSSKGELLSKIKEKMSYANGPNKVQLASYINSLITGKESGSSDSATSTPDDHGDDHEHGSSSSPSSARAESTSSSSAESGAESTTEYVAEEVQSTEFSPDVAQDVMKLQDDGSWLIEGLTDLQIQQCRITDFVGPGLTTVDEVSPDELSRTTILSDGIEYKWGIANNGFQSWVDGSKNRLKVFNGTQFSVNIADAPESTDTESAEGADDSGSTEESEVTEEGAQEVRITEDIVPEPYNDGTYDTSIPYQVTVAEGRLLIAEELPSLPEEYEALSKEFRILTRKAEKIYDLLDLIDSNKVPEKEKYLRARQRRKAKNAVKRLDALHGEVVNTIAELERSGGSENTINKLKAYVPAISKRANNLRHLDRAPGQELPDSERSKKAKETQAPTRVEFENPVRAEIGEEVTIVADAEEIKDEDVQDSEQKKKRFKPVKRRDFQLTSSTVVVENEMPTDESGIDEDVAANDESLDEVEEDSDEILANIDHLNDAQLMKKIRNKLKRRKGKVDVVEKEYRASASLINQSENTEADVFQRNGDSMRDAQLKKLEKLAALTKAGKERSDDPAFFGLDSQVRALQKVYIGLDFKVKNERISAHEDAIAERQRVDDSVEGSESQSTEDEEGIGVDTTSAEVDANEAVA